MIVIIKRFLCGKRGHHRDVQEVLERMERLMTKLDDLKAALDTEIAAAVASVDKAVVAMQVAVDAINTSHANDAAIQTLIDQVNGAAVLGVKLDTASDALTAAVGP